MANHCKIQKPQKYNKKRLREFESITREEITLLSDDLIKLMFSEYHRRRREAERKN